MPSATTRPYAHDLARRRMGFGLLLSLAVHALVLSIHFGLPGMMSGGSGPITLTLAPPVLLRVLTSVPGLPAPEAGVGAPVSPEPGVAVPAPSAHPSSGSGFRVLDPVPLAPPPAPAQVAPRPVAKRRRALRPPAPSLDAATPVIVQQDNPDTAFKVPPGDAADLPQAPEAPVPETETLDGLDLAGPEPVADAASEDVQALAREQESRRQAQRLANSEAQRMEAERVAAERVTEQLALEARARRQDEEAQARQAAQHAHEESRLAAQRAEEERARLHERREREQQEEAQREARRLAAAERELARQREAQAAQQLLAEQQRQVQEQERLRARQVAEAQVEAQARVLAQQRADEERRSREAAAAEAEEHARRLAAETRARELAAETERHRQAEEEAARRRAEQLARQQAEDELARRRADALARQRADEALRDERMRHAAQLAGGPGRASQEGPVGLPDAGVMDGKGAGAGMLPRDMLGRNLGSRARELMRGIELPGAPPATLRPVEVPDALRRVVDTAEHDVPLRLYVESFRQKIERNAALIQTHLSGDPTRSSPLVSVAVRSDGSIDDVTILRSSGRRDTDEAVRRIVRLNARYAAFPPNVAARFDVIEIRRIWLLSETLKLLEEIR